MVLIEVIIALSFVFFLLSVLVSGLQEAFAILLNKRGRELQRAVGLILDQLGPNLSKDFFDHPRIRALAERPKSDSIRGGGLHLINFFRRSKFKHSFPPSYIDQKSFARALSDIMVMGRDLRTTDGLPDLVSLQELYIVLESLDYNNFRNFESLQASGPVPSPRAKEIWDKLAGVADEASFVKVKSELLNKLKRDIEADQLTSPADGKYFEKLRSRLLTKPASEATDVIDLFLLHNDTLDGWLKNTEEWFDRYMDRVSGWYKKRSHTNVFWISVALVIMFNLDAIQMTKIIYHDASVRAALVAQADLFVDSTLTIDSILAEPFAFFEQIMALDVAWKDLKNHLPGWLLTIMAMSLGAPFWFDMFSRFARLRGTGPKPAATTNEGGTDDTS